MDHRGAAPETKLRFDLMRSLADDPARVLEIEGHQAAADLGAIAIDDDDGVATREAARHCRDARRQTTPSGDTAMLEGRLPLITWYPSSSLPILTLRSTRGAAGLEMS